MSQPLRPSPGRAATSLEGARSRVRILDAAERLLAERGFSGTGIAAISRESGLPASSIYWFFQNKRDLVATVVERAADRWTDAFEGPGLPLRGEGAIRQFLARALEQSGSRLPDFVRLQLLLSLERGEVDPELRVRLQRIRDRVLELLSGAIGAALTARGAPPPQRLVAEIAGMSMAMAEGALIAKHIDPAQVDLATLAEDLEAAILGIARHRLSLETW